VGDRVVSVYSTQQQAQETIQPPPKPGLGIGLAPVHVALAADIRRVEIELIAIEARS
jgi:hypothetical protein